MHCTSYPSWQRGSLFYSLRIVLIFSYVFVLKPLDDRFSRKYENECIRNVRKESTTEAKQKEDDPLIAIGCMGSG